MELLLKKISEYHFSFPRTGSTGGRPRDSRSWLTLHRPLSGAFIEIIWGTVKWKRRTFCCKLAIMQSTLVFGNTWLSVWLSYSTLWCRTILLSTVVFVFADLSRRPGSRKVSSFLHLSTYVQWNTRVLQVLINWFLK